MARTAYILPSSIRIKLYYSLVHPYLSYCNMVWASTYVTRLHRVNILQKELFVLLWELHMALTLPAYSSILKF